MRVIHPFIFVLISVIHICSSARILGVFPVPSISHQVVFRALIEELAKRGHHIVTITTDPLGASAPPYYKNVTEIDIHDVSYSLFRESVDLTSFRNNADDMLLQSVNWFPHLIEAQLSSPAFQEFLSNRNQSFDLVLAESLSPIAFAFGAYFEAPVIGVSSFTGTVSNFEAVGSPSHPLLYPDWNRRYGSKLNFWQKIVTLKTDLIQRYVWYISTPMYDEVIRKYMGDGLPSITEMENSMEMLFINQHAILMGARPTVPAVVYMGNMHMKPLKPLPKDLKKILDESPQGVIYFSLGSNILSKDLSTPTLNIILQALSELEYTVLWKFENDTLSGRPDNVHISKWFPQIDVLGHPNVKAFITQGGQQSMEEAIYNKVPFIGIPFMADQDLNVCRMVELGMGVGLEIGTLSKSNLLEAIVEVAEGESYHRNVEKISVLIADQPMTGKERAVWWTEYVLRHGSARHLRAPAADISWHEYFMLDVLGPLFLLALIVFISLYVIVRKIAIIILQILCGGNKLKQN